MAGNSERIDDIVDRAKVSGQINDTITEVVALEKALGAAAKQAADLNKSILGARNFAEYQKQAEASTKATRTVVDNTERSRLAEIRLQQQRERSFDVYERNLQREAQARERAANREIQADQRQLASEARIARQRARDSAAFIELVRNRDLAVERARNLGATVGTENELFTAATNEANVLQRRVDGINQSLGNYRENVGNYAGRAFGVIRQLAYILPGIGIAGIFGLITEGIVGFFKAISDGERTLATFNELERKANDLFASQATSVNLLVAEIKNQNTTSERRVEIIEELNKVSPTYFGNLKSEQDIVSKLPDDYKKYNDALFANSRAKAAAELIGDKYKQILGLQRDIIEGNQVDNEDRAGGFAAFRELSFSLDQIAEPGREKRIVSLQKQIKTLTNIYVDSNQKAGDIFGTANGIQERIANNQTELQKTQLQSIADFNNDIANNAQKSYSQRRNALKIATDAENRILGLGLNQQLNDITLTNDAKAVVLEKYNADTQKKNIESDKRDRELTRSASKDQIEVYKNRLERQKATEEEILSNTTKGYKDRFDAVDKYEKLSKDLIKTNANEQIKDAGENGIKIKGIQEQRQADLIKVDADGNKKRSVIQKELNSEVAKLEKQRFEQLKSGLAQEVLEFQDAQNQKLLDIDKQRSQAASGLADEYAKGKISALQYNKQLYDLDEAASLQRADVQIAAAESVVKAQAAAIALGFGSGKDLQKSTNDLAKLQIQKSDLVTNNELNNIRKIEAARNQLHAKQKELADAALTLIQTIVDAGYQRQLDALEEQSKQVDLNADNEKKAVDRSLLSTQQKADKNAIIDAQAIAQKEAIAVREKKIRHDQAVFDRAIAIARIIQETAIGIVQALTVPIIGIALAEVIGALGAVQLATVLATPLPQFAAGGTVGKDGHIITGELGTELRIDPDGKTSLTKDFANVSYARKGTKIVPHMELMGMLKAQDIKYTGGQVVDMTGVIKAIKDNKPQQSKQPVLNGWGREIRGMEKYNNYSKKHFR